MTIKEIAVIGSGQMGSGIAQVASLAGYSVLLIDLKEEYLSKAMGNIEFSLGKFVSKEKLTQKELKN